MIDFKTFAMAGLAAAAGAAGLAFLPSGTPSASVTAEEFAELKDEVAALRANAAGLDAGMQTLIASVAGKDEIAVLQARLAKAEAALSATGSIKRKK
ncbi:MAG TPA: hypothetical protein PKD49_07605 [Hyphomicrobium sp.]|mgnify:CR=1 FL=1|nr:hypothetical protein [Hyphomicrobium sp.]